MAKILGVGKFVPEHVVSNDDLSALMETSDEWIQTRSGIRERHWVRDIQRPLEGGIQSVDIAYGCAVAALNRAGLQISEIDAIVYATITPDFEIPGSGPSLLEKLGSKPIPVFEVRNHCSGFLYGLSLARAYIDSGAYRKILLIGCELQSSGLDISTRGRTTAVLFGDGGGAVVLGTGEGILRMTLGSDGDYADRLGVESPTFRRAIPILQSDFEGDAPSMFPRMDGKLVFKMASQKMPEIVRNMVSESGYTLDDVTLIIPHQANQRILDMLGHDLRCPERVFSNIARYGNTTAGSIPLALTEAIEEGRLKSGDLVCLVSFGAGFSWGGALIRW